MELKKDWASSLFYNITLPSEKEEAGMHLHEAASH